MTKGTVIFVSDSGTEFSVRAARDTSTATPTLEPVYASDLELLDGAVGELRGAGESVRGTLRRRGGVFVLDAEKRQGEVVQKTDSGRLRRWKHPRRHRTPRPPDSKAESVRSDAVAIEAAQTLEQFIRGERRITLEAAKQAHSVISRFIADHERHIKERQ